MKRIYVAGPYNGPTVIDVLRNMNRGIEACVELLLAGYAPFCPWLDFQFGLKADIPGEAYKAFSMEWLKVSHAVLVLPGWADSEGTQAEMRMAHRLNIPIFFKAIEIYDWEEAERLIREAGKRE